jgi:hypothetical protein
MRKRMFNWLYALGWLNLVLFGGCWISMTITPSSGPEGIGTALLAHFSLFLSAIFAGLGLNQALVESRRGVIARRTVLVTLLAATPLLFYILVQVIFVRSHSKSRSGLKEPKINHVHQGTNALAQRGIPAMPATFTANWLEAGAQKDSGVSL